jgi:hypothetical protein
MRRSGLLSLAFMVWTGGLFLFPVDASAIPAFARRYGLSCSTCHSAWPVLNAAGWSFRMSGYRRLNGRDLEPTTKDIELYMGALSMPAIPPLALTASFGFDFQQIKRTDSDGNKATQVGSSLNAEAIELFVAAPLGKHLSVFTEFPMFETHTDGPTGPAEATADAVSDPGSRRDIQFETESPTFEKAKAIWNTLLPEGWLPTDSLNIVVGVDELPLAFSPEGRRLSTRPYLVYKRRALDLLSGTKLEDLLPNGSEADHLLRLGEPQILVELNGLLVPGGNLTDLAKPDTLSLEYHVGMTNGSNINSDPNREKDFFGRLALRWWGVTLGVFGYYSPDIYDTGQRTDGSIAGNPSGEGIFSGAERHNEFYAVGPDLTLNLEPFDIPVWLEAQVLFNRESNPTGFNKSFSWWGGFGQFNWKIFRPLVAYGRYDWIDGNHFDDTDAGGATGSVKPREWAAVAGLQWYVLENLKLVGEYSRREFENTASAPAHQRIQEDFFTLRAHLGF